MRYKKKEERMEGEGGGAGKKEVLSMLLLAKTE